jgi:hypothetical protein
VASLYQSSVLATPASLFAHVFDEAAEGWIVTFTGRQARLENHEARPNELTTTRQRCFRYPAASRTTSKYLRSEADAGRDTYFGVHLYREAGNRFASNAVLALSCLWLDEDGGHYPEDGPEPTAIVQSSTDRRHLYWRLSRPLSAESVVTMNRRIANWAGGDSSKAGLSSVLRPPGTRNFKRHPRIDQVVGMLTGVGPWDPEVLDQAVPPLPEYNTPLKAPRGTYDGPEIELLDYVRSAGIQILGEVADGGGRKLAIVCPWVDEHSGGDRTGTYAGQYDDGALWFYCHHEHCHGRGWRDLRRKARPAKAGKVVIRLV